MSRFGKTHGVVWAICGVLFFGTLLIFSRAVPHDFLDLDDGDYVTGNPHVQGGLNWPDVRWAFTANVAANWHPLTLLSHMLDCQLFGSSAPGHHATNIVWHALNAVLAFLALRRLTGALWPSAFSAAMFAWHPLRVESVAWIAERKDLLSGFFFFLTLLAYAHYVEKQNTGKPKARFFYALTLLFFALGLMCKPMLVTVPFLLLLLDFWPLQRFDERLNASAITRLLIEKIPFFLLSAASCVVTYFYQKAAGAMAETFPLSERLANAVISVARYLGKFFWPFDLTVGYPLPGHWPALEILAATLLVLAITAVAIWQWRQRPWLFVGWFWFLGMLVPVIGLMQAGLQAMADRYTYLPILGVQLMLLWTLRELFSQPIRFHLPYWLKPATLLLLLGCCAARTWNQLDVWRNSSTLQEHALAVTRDNYLAHFYLATTLMNENHNDEAVSHLQRALELKPNFTEAHYRLGVALQYLGRTGEAKTVFQAVLKDDPGYGVADYSLGELFIKENQPALAVPYFQAALQTKPDYDPAYVALGTAYSDMDQAQQAITNFAKALALNPRNAPAHYDWANTLVDLHREPEALPHYEKAIELDTNFEAAYCNYGNALRALNRPDDASVQYRHALTLQPNDAAAWYGLGAAQDDSGQTAAALASYNEAIRLQPDYADAHYDIGTIFLNQNHPAEAIPHFQAAIKSQPNYSLAYLGQGLALAQLGRQSEAIGCYQHVLAITPDSADALCCIGVALRHEGRLAEAVPYDEHALRVQPDNAEANAELGNALYQTGHPEAAIPYLEQALKLHPGFPGVSKLLAQAQNSPQANAK